MPPIPLPSDVVTDLEGRARLDVYGGYDGLHRIVEELVELVEYDPGTQELVAPIKAEVVEAIQQMVDRYMAEHASAEHSFPSTTDCDRLTTAFEGLERADIIAREDVGYTQSDLRDEMRELVDHAVSRGVSPRGWAAFHRQDVQRVVDSGVLYISFASTTDDDAGFRLIGEEVAAALGDVGLTVDWNGDPGRRIVMSGLRWQRRRRPLG